MGKYRDLNTGDALPAPFMDALEEFICSYVSQNFAVTLASSTSVQIVAGTNNGDDQVACAIDSLWRYITATATASHPGGGAGNFDVLVVCSANNFPSTNVDSTDYTFGLKIVTTGGTPTGSFNGHAISNWRKVATVAWNGTAITSIAQLVNAELTDHNSQKTGAHGIPTLTDGQGLVWQSGAWTAVDVATQAELNAVAAAAQPLDSDLTAIAALTTDPFGRGLLVQTSGVNVRSYIGAPASASPTLTGVLTLFPTGGQLRLTGSASALTTATTLSATADTMVPVAASAPLTVTLPTSPQLGTIFVIHDLTGTAATDPITIARGGSPLIPINGQAKDLLIAENYGGYLLQCVSVAGTGMGWIAIPIAGSGSRTPPAFAANTSSMTIANTTQEIGSWTNEEFDTSNWFNPTNGRFTPLVAGTYRLSWRISLADGIDADIFDAFLAKNGATHRISALGRTPNQQQQGYSAIHMGMAFGTALVVANGSTDYFSLFVRPNSAVSFGSALCNSVGTYFQGELVR